MSKKETNKYLNKYKEKYSLEMANMTIPETLAKENLKYLVYCLFFTSFRDSIVIITYNIKLVNIEIKSAYKCTLHFYKQHLIQINTHNQLKNL